MMPLKTPGTGKPPHTLHYRSFSHCLQLRWSHCNSEASLYYPMLNLFDLCSISVVAKQTCLLIFGIRFTFT